MTAAAAPAAPGRPAARVPDDPFELLRGDAVVAVAMSGGVDSSVAAARCAERGLRTVGITLAMWPRDGERRRDRGCCSIDAVEDARRVATGIGIPHYSWNLEPEFQRDVVAPFEDEYAAGRTPNPCVRCNQMIKFGVLLDRARAAGATHLATGHYARIGRRGEAASLHRARATAKDQAYTLHRLEQAQLLSSVFPLGAEASKDEVRRQAADLGLITAAKPDSQELCFVDGPVRAELERRLRGRFRPGAMVDQAGAVVGEHRGVPFYTVGQRSGLGVPPSCPDAAPLFVTAVDATANTVTVGPRRALECDSVRLIDIHWIDRPPTPDAPLALQLRAHSVPAPVAVVQLGNDAVLLRCNPPVTQVAPGQAAVLFDGDEVIGGGTVVPT
ncbi:MAG: tRNA 2-thiouridine(34) synthase MnmA [Candidatus Dormibacteraeota bacterium]|nr:tRNA 2-thiouridine(34) synthase MnmA [Candidatus Dormibacteraeota bacterium]